MDARLCFLVLVAVAAAVASNTRRTYGGQSANTASIVRDERTQNDHGEYSFQYETSDGVARHESGSQRDGQVAQGGWRYTSPEGEAVDITFVADHEGYKPQGDVLPVAPALPFQPSQGYN
ncbi:endocuticle structural glycoprotein SgAbd-5-like [Panulirus ornatus]|uniref:endocuticle structural glycoprotein SgAbd-5-like n=1 Tax=Panulirus ornatus TaxID=150431 RepID=UPI003A843010